MPGGLDTRIKREQAQALNLDNIQRQRDMSGPTAALANAQQLENLYNSQQARGESQERLPAELEQRVLQNLGLGHANTALSQNIAAFEGNQQRAAEASTAQTDDFRDQIRSRAAQEGMERDKITNQNDQFETTSKSVMDQITSRLLGMLSQNTNIDDPAQNFLSQRGIEGDVIHTPTIAENMEAQQQAMIQRQQQQQQAFQEQLNGTPIQ